MGRHGRTGRPLPPDVICFPQQGTARGVVCNTPPVRLCHADCLAPPDAGQGVISTEGSAEGSEFPSWDCRGILRGVGVCSPAFFIRGGDVIMRFKMPVNGKEIVIHCPGCGETNFSTREDSFKFWIKCMNCGLEVRADGSEPGKTPKLALAWEDENKPRIDLKPIRDMPIDSRP